MAPITPFLTEVMFQNLRKALPPPAAASVHFQNIPEASPAQEGDDRIEVSVTRMQTVIELGRVVRERRNVPTRTPLRRLTVAHADPAFVADITGAHFPQFCAPCLRASSCFRALVAPCAALLWPSVVSLRCFGSLCSDAHAAAAADSRTRRPRLRRRHHRCALSTFLFCELFLLLVCALPAVPVPSFRRAWPCCGHAL